MDKTVEPMSSEKKTEYIRMIAELRRLINQQQGANQQQLNRDAQELDEWLNNGMNFGKKKKKSRKSRKSRRKSKKKI